MKSFLTNKIFPKNTHFGPKQLISDHNIQFYYQYPSKRGDIKTKDGVS